ncbi:MAG: hypothetical protein N2C14_02085, partial [Planctomycetales bacterium]
SIQGFSANDFPELGADRQRELQIAVQEFKAIASQVPADKFATSEQYTSAALAFQKMLALLESYMPLPREAKDVESVLRGLDFPSCVVNWDYDLGADEEGNAAVWVNVFVDGTSIHPSQLGRIASELNSEIHRKLTDAKVSRWPYLRIRTATEHKAATG